MAIAALAMGLLAAFGPAHADTAPAWMHALAGVPTPAHDEKADSILMYTEKVLTVRPNGTLKVMERKAFRILRPNGQKRGIVRVDFDGQSKVTALRAWCIPASGKDYTVRDRDIVESALPGIENGELIRDLRSRLAQIPASEPGSLVGYEYEQEQQPYFMDDDWDFQETVPVHEAHYSLQLPPGWSYRASWINHAEVTRVAFGEGRWRWDVTDIPAIPVEEDMPPWRGIAARLEISLIPPGTGAQGWVEWKDVGRWYDQLSDARREPSPEIRQKVAELTRDAASPADKMRILARFVQDEIRYVAIELGIGGYQPHSARDVFAGRYGDCKDKAALLASMLKEVGIDSYFVLINAERGAVDAATPPNRAFNHAILAIRLPEGVTDASFLGKAQYPGIGYVLFFDPTNTLTPFGQLAGSLQANFGLLVVPGGGELVQLPQLMPSESGVDRVAHLVLDEKGVLKGDFDETWRGDAAASARYRLRAAKQEADRIKPVEALAAESLSTFWIDQASISNLPALDQPFRWRYTLTAENYAKVAGDLLLVRPRVLGSHASGLLERKEARQHPIEFDGPEHSSDRFEIQIPPQFAIEDLPPPVNVDYDFASYHSKTERVGSLLRYSRVLEIKQVAVPASRSAELKTFFREIHNDERRAAVLKRIGS